MRIAEGMLVWRWRGRFHHAWLPALWIGSTGRAFGVILVWHWRGWHHIRIRLA